MRKKFFCAKGGEALEQFCSEMAWIAPLLSAFGLSAYGNTNVTLRTASGCSAIPILLVTHLQMLAGLWQLQT